MASILVTGITGQDGSYLRERLVAQGHDVHGLVRAGEQPHLPGVTVHRGDLAEAGAVSAVLRAVEPDVVYNLGGISSVAMSWRKPALTARVSGAAVAEILSALRDQQDRTGRPVRFLQASSAEIFGAPTSAPQDETTPLRPVSPYGAAKAFAHQLVQVFRGAGLHASTVILYNHESPRRPESFVTRKITAAAARIAREGGTVALGNLDAERDWGWAPDYVDAMVRAVEHDEPGDYVVATGVARSVRDFVRAAFARAGIEDWEAHVEIDPRYFRPNDAPLLVGDAARARAVLGWVPSVTFEEVVSRMVEADLG